LERSPSTYDEQIAVAAPRSEAGAIVMAYFVGLDVNNFVFLTAGVGGLAGGMVLTAFNTM
jgi:hypothetical protein